MSNEGCLGEASLAVLSGGFYFFFWMSFFLVFFFFLSPPFGIGLFLLMHLKKEGTVLLIHGFWKNAMMGDWGGLKMGCLGLDSLSVLSGGLFLDFFFLIQGFWIGLFLFDSWVLEGML